jgi:hypothetical protein
LEHVTHAHREALVTTIRLTCEYVMEFSSDADILKLQAILAEQAASIAQYMSQMGEGLYGPQASCRPPSDMAGQALHQLAPGRTHG